MPIRWLIDYICNIIQYFKFNYSIILLRKSETNWQKESISFLVSIRQIWANPFASLTLIAQFIELSRHNAEMRLISS